MLPKSLQGSESLRSVPKSRVSSFASCCADRHLMMMLMTQVELHVHLDGSIRHETAWELLKAKNLPLPGKGSLQELKEACGVQEPKDLAHFLAGFRHFAPAFA